MTTLTHHSENSYPTRWELSPTPVRILTRLSENSHPPKWELSPARVRTLTFGEKNDFYLASSIQEYSSFTDVIWQMQYPVQMSRARQQA